ncbi:MAG: hypothetical protein AAFR04_01730 [Pseudomonadota bacterium]
MSSSVKQLAQPELKKTERRVVARPSLTIHMRRFPANCRANAKRLVAADSRLADLAYTFPGALIAIVSDCLASAQRQRALNAVLAGAPLKRVASLLGMAMWMRRLPPEAYARWSPPLPTGTDFSRRIAAHLPHNVAFSPVWLSNVRDAAALDEPETAIWIARTITPAIEMPASGHPLLPLFMFAWYSRHPDTRLGSMIARPFYSCMKLESVITAAEDWLIDVNLALHLPDDVPADSWMEGGLVEGLRFVPLTTAAELRSEAMAMQNCLKRYAQSVAQRDCLLFSIRRGTRRLAVIKIDQHERETNMATIDDIKGPMNTPAPAYLWRAAHIWLGRELGAGRPAFDRKVALAHTRYLQALARDRTKTWQAMCLPYFRAKQHLRRTASSARTRMHFTAAMQILRDGHGLETLEASLRGLSHGAGRSSRLTFGL